MIIWFDNIFLEIFVTNFLCLVNVVAHVQGHKKLQLQISKKITALSREVPEGRRVSYEI